MTHFNRKHYSVFYGWWIVVACFIHGILQGGFVALGFTAFFEPIANEFGWSYTHISAAASLRGIEVGLLAPFIGFLVDRWGPRLLMLAGVILTGFSLVFLSYINSLGMFYLGFALVAMGMSGSSPTVVMTTMANWFRKKLGIATGIIGSGFACGGLMIPLVVKLIDVYNWRTALFIVGVITWVLGVPLAPVLRHKPEQYGYLPDGEKSIITITDQVLVPAETREVGIGARQAVRSRAFWHIVLATMFQLIAISTVTVHVMPYLSSVGITRSTASLVATSAPLVSIAGRLSSGWLSDRHNKKRVAIGFFATVVLGMLCMSYTSSEAMWLIVLFILFFGIGWGAYGTLRVALLSGYFGRSKFGSIFGIMMGIQALGGIIGPLFAGWVYDYWASYQIAWLSLTVLVFVATIIIATTPPIATSAQLADKQ